MPLDNNCQSFESRSTCPLCKEEMVIHWQGDNIPYFGEVMYVTARCKCSFKFTDTMILQEREPIHYEMIIDGIDDLNARVIRSTSGTITVPELGIMVEPGTTSDAYVTNVEGVLNRLNDVLDTAIRWYGDDKSKLAKADELKAKLLSVFKGTDKLTLVIEDPFGNSAIINEKATSRKLSEHEAAKLKTGMFIYDVGTSEIVSNE
ncbi:ZPR1 zinc finger domain-containing protein [Methanosalsum natronophilum]|uniref:ZPR1 zinc finger domain-containing protein n=1 Tax=Methanosalsum natronophilum TaxID=768733 RepID=A0A3R7YGM7_9EURY|nr:ZPR1 zinc finger domain-containing protein [Methanosalsum natronophilum]MCS3924502.1 zinc finger protein [Methanosalsum natronophilum]RQD82663.1 MAG: ZPR1 zinc finger domain-containing protein [Methanosalsum natronophilum]